MPGDRRAWMRRRTMPVTPDARRARPRRWLGVVAWTLWVLAMAVWLVIPWLDDRLRQAGRSDLTQWDLRPGVAAVSVATVGAVLASRRPRHPVGWLLLAQVATNLATGAAAQYLAWDSCRVGPCQPPGQWPWPTRPAPVAGCSCWALSCC